MAVGQKIPSASRSLLGRLLIAYLAFQPSRPPRTPHPPLAEQCKGCQRSRLMRRLPYDCPRHRGYGMALRSQSTCGAWRSRRRCDIRECTPFAACERPWCPPRHCVRERCQWTKSFGSRREQWTRVDRGIKFSWTGAVIFNCRPNTH